jgi:uncharacterized YccA/Bax inhibitor family protein
VSEFASGILITSIFCGIFGMIIGWFVGYRMGFIHGTDNAMAAFEQLERSRGASRD